MFPATSLLALATLALSVAASPAARGSPITLPIARRLNASNGPVNLHQRDQARAAALKARGQAIKEGKLDRRAASVPVTNEVDTYIAAVGVGSPATTYNLIVDTGSSNTWVGAGTAYEETSTSKATGYNVEVTYGSGSFSGKEYTDTVTLGTLTITGQSIGVASTSEGFEGVDGILGIGPTDLTEGTLTNDEDAEIPTVTDNLYSQGTISTEVVGVSFEPTTSEEVTNGELTFGGTDSSKYTGTIAYTPVTTTEPASYYWGINESIDYGSETILSETAGIVDTGTTLVLLATNAYDKYVSATGATYDDTTGLLRISSSDYDKLDDLNFNIGSNTYALTANAQIWPRSLNTYIGGSSDDIYLVVNDLGSPSGEGLDFINGYTFLERYYSVFDTTNSRVGFATTEYTDATTN
ncbi:aspartic proteinase [Coniophora puteana RWD-64-598 SS2]|uniref:Aspartic proteinase n=1 Tax=Coniophora puteana (strain RWD-64-598) TaxID=741705 RepID=A0A5M3N7A9_CONPW|nr:aspartic proteinase [Coniophora puteana RWD-64-598 SS2]EIW86974.1 aspartic proteinase [Coniophora puteana RWD-64-598 SS2]